MSTFLSPLIEQIIHVSINYSNNNNSSGNNTSSEDCSSIVKGYHKVKWIENVFGECVRTPMEQASFYIGLVSLCFWFFSYIPQIIQNYKRQNTGLTLGMLIQWFLGDLFNLLGVVTIGNLVTQNIAGGYYVLMDSVMIVQWFYYTAKRKWIERRKNKYDDKVREMPETPTTPTEGEHDLLLREDQLGSTSNNNFSQHSSQQHIKLYSFLTFSVVLCGAYFVLHNLSFSSTASGTNQLIPSLDGSDSGSHIGHMGRKLLSVHERIPLPPIKQISIMDERRDEDAWKYEWPPRKPISIFGYVVGCLSSLFYFTSRIPQFLENLKRRSCEGLSPLLFYSAFMGNVTYVIGVLLYSTHFRYLMLQLPFIVGAFLVFTMDMLILFQFILYEWIMKTGKSSSAPKTKEMDA